MEKKPISRRDFIKGAGLAVGAGILAACTPQTVIQTQVVEKQVTAVVTQVVEKTSVVKETVQSVVTATPAPSRIVAMSFCEPRSWTRVLSS